MNSDAIVGTISAQLVISYFASAVLEWAKGRDWIPWVDFDTAVVNRITASVLAALQAASIHWEFDMAAGILTVTGLTVTGVLGSLWHFFIEWGRAWMMQKVLYKTLIAQPPKN